MNTFHVVTGGSALSLFGVVSQMEIICDVGMEQLKNNKESMWTDICYNSKWR